MENGRLIATIWVHMLYTMEHVTRAHGRFSLKMSFLFLDQFSQ